MGIILRAPEPEDIDILYDWENRQDLWQVSNTVTPFSRFVLSKYLETAHMDIFQTRQLRLMIDLTGEKIKTIGAVDLFDYEPIHQRAGVGILIAESSEKGKGNAGLALKELKDYVFNVLLLNQLYCNIGIKNEASLNLFGKNEFVEVGRKKRWNKTPFGFEDEVMFQCFNPNFSK